MVGEIELVSDGDGLVVSGDQSAIERFLDHAGLLADAQEFPLARLSSFLNSGADIAKTASGIAEQSAMYLKLTPEYAKRLRDAGGLMKTQTKGISYAMLGEPGKTSLKWLQVQDGPGSLLTNPAVLSGIGGLLSQFAQQSEASALNALLVKIDGKLDDVRRAQRNAVLAKLNRAAASLEEAMTIHQHGGDPATLWNKVQGESATILEVQSDALEALGDIAEKAEGNSKVGEVKRATKEIEHEVGVQLAILARCFELHDEFRIVELDHVHATAPQTFDNHRIGLLEARNNRRRAVLERTSRLMDRMVAAGGIANANILLHARAARSIVDSLNSTAAIVDDFHAPLGIETQYESLSATRWGEALRDSQQLKQAAAEVGQKAVVAGGIGLGAAAIAFGKNSRRGSS